MSNDSSTSSRGLRPTCKSVVFVFMALVVTFGGCVVLTAQILQFTSGLIVLVALQMILLGLAFARVAYNASLSSNRNQVQPTESTLEAGSQKSESDETKGDDSTTSSRGEEIPEAVATPIDQPAPGTPSAIQVVSTLSIPSGAPAEA
ncbi:hypothetical protein ACHAWF_010628 [Thalassiosira exigua]